MNGEDQLRQLREKMVQDQLAARGINNQRVLQAMRDIPRHAFVPIELRNNAYEDRPQHIGDEQTISQPYIVGYMTQAINPLPHHTVLEIGTGSGYQTALLARLAEYVYSLERFPRLAEKAGRILSSLGYNNLDIHIGDGSQGLPDMAPFHSIIVTAAAPSLPGPLCTQMHPNGGTMIIPVGTRKLQKLQLVTRIDDKWRIKNLIAVRFVPLIGRYGFAPAEG